MHWLLAIYVHPVICSPRISESKLELRRLKSLGNEDTNPGKLESFGQEKELRV